MRTVYNYPLEELDESLRPKKTVLSDNKKTNETFNSPEFFYNDEETEYSDEVEGLALQTVELIRL
jgi:hypothetical protein